MFERLKVYNDTGRVVPTHVEINGRPVRCKSLKYECASDSIPTVNLELYTITDLDVSNIGRIWVSISPENLKEANDIIRFELLKRKDYYHGMMLTIESALQDSGITNAHVVASQVLNRIIGDDIKTDSMA